MDIKFIQGNLNQWNKYQINNVIIWLAGNEKENILKKIKNLNIDELDENKISKILNNINSHFGIIVYTNRLFFAGVDCARN